MSSSSHPFRANAHLLKLLGDELIGDDRLAIFELIKNSYDADATSVDVLLDIEGDTLTITDNGAGMGKDTILDKWLEVGTPSKRGSQRSETEHFKRVPLGEKGVGRLAAHKVGNTLKIQSKEKNKPEIAIEIQWSNIIDDSKQISDVKIDITESPKHKLYPGPSTGTQITITSLHKRDWTRGELRKLKRMTTTLVSPFSTKDDFSVNFEVPGREHWLEDLFTVEDILEQAIYSFDFSLNKKGKISWNYEFSPPPTARSLHNRSLSGQDEDLELLRNQSSKKTLYMPTNYLDGIGEIHGEFYVYDRRPKVLSSLPETKAMKDYLDEQTGVRIYRDGIRVYNYGEPGNDWLDLDAGRINAPAKKMGTRSVIAAIHLDLESSHKLNEKTNREGFDENEAYKRFQTIIKSIVAQIDIIRQEDRRNLDQALSSSDQINKTSESSFHDSLSKIRKTIQKDKKIEKEVAPHLQRIESEYASLQKIMMHSGLSGLNMALIFHEIERELGFLNQAIKNKDNLSSLLDRSSHLLELIDGFAPLLRRNTEKIFNLSSLINSAHKNNAGRFKFHEIIFSSPITSGEEEDITLKAPSNLILGVLHNLIDNAIYWSRKGSEKPGSTKNGAILVTNVTEIIGKPSIAIIDNGPGFSLTPEDAIKPFIFKRLGGTGLGLYFSHLTMQALGGSLTITSGRELDVSQSHLGGAVILTFGGKNVSK